MAVDFNELQATLWRDISTNLGGVDAVFTPLVGDVSCFKVILERNTQTRPDEHTQPLFQDITIEYSLLDLNQEVIPGDTFSISGITYITQSIIKNDEYVVKVSVTRTPVNPGYDPTTGNII